MILVRSNANPPLDENNPETLAQLQSYLGREQYGSWPIGYGQYWNSPAFSDCDADHRGPDKIKYMKLSSLKTKGISEEGYQILTNVGEGGGQTVMHLHFHLLSGKPIAL